MKRPYAVIPVLLLTTWAHAAVLYSLTDLGTLPGGNSSRAYAINNAGQIVGESDAIGSFGVTHPFLYGNGVMTDLDPGNNIASASARAINNAGQVVGWTGSDHHAFRYSNGTMTNLGEGMEARGINDAGKIVGTDNNSVRAVTWTAGGAMSYLDQQLPPGSGWALYDAMGINISGQIVGSGLAPGGTAQHVYRFSGGVATDLGSLNENYHVATAINDDGVVIGNYYAGLNRAFRYSNGTLSDLGTLAWDAFANDINASGQIAGSSSYPGDPRAVIWNGGVITDLNTVTVLPGGWKLTSANGINDGGQIVGTMYVSGFDHAYLLTPIPEPAGLVALSALFSATQLFHRNRRES